MLLKNKERLEKALNIHKVLKIVKLLIEISY